MGCGAAKTTEDTEPSAVPVAAAAAPVGPSSSQGLDVPTEIGRLFQQLQNNAVLKNEQEAARQLKERVLLMSGFSQPMSGMFSADLEHHRNAQRNANMDICNTYTEHNPDISEALLAAAETSGKLYSDADLYLEYLKAAFCALGGPRYQQEYISCKDCIRNLFQVWNADVVFVSAYLNLWPDAHVFIGGGTASAVKFWQMFGKPDSKCFFFYDYVDCQFHNNFRTSIAQARGPGALVPPLAWYSLSKSDWSGDIVLQKLESQGELHGIMQRLGGKVVAGIGGIGLTPSAKQAIDDLYA